MQEMNRHLAQRLKGLRAELGWSLDVAARETGVSKAMLGQIERGEVESILGTSDRTARRVTSALLEAGALYSVSTRAPLKLAFPAKYAGRWMPGLFPDRED